MGDLLGRRFLGRAAVVHHARMHVGGQGEAQDRDILVVIKGERVADGGVPGAGVADARAVLDERVDVDLLSERRLRDVDHLYHHPIPSSGSINGFSVRPDRGIHRVCFVNVTIVAADRRIFVGIRENEADAGIVERADREQKAQRGAHRFDRVSRNRLKTEVLYLVPRHRGRREEREQQQAEKDGNDNERESG